MATRMQQRRGTAAQWTTANPILAAGEIGFETDTSKFKMGNGSSTWSALQYYASAAELNTAISNLIDAAPGTLDTLNELAAAIGDDPAFFTNMAASISGSIDQHNGTINVHGIANTTLLATTANVSTAQTAAEGFATTEVTNHKNATTNIHGIDDTSALAKTSEVSTAIGNAVTTHSSDTTEVHGIADTSALATKTYADSAVTTHNTDTTDVHGITNTADLATKSYADTAVSTHSDETLLVHGIADTALLATKTYADTAVSTHQADTEDVHGISNTANLVYTADLTDHNNDTLDVHGISNTANLAYLSDLTTHNDDTLGVHGIANTTLLATQDYVDTAVGNSTVDQSLFAGVGIDWNETTDQFDIDSTVATTTYVGTEIGTHNSDTTNVHGIADTSALALTETVNTALALKAPLASPTFTGTVTLPTGTVTSGMILDGTIVNADINASAAIAQSKIADLTTDLAAKAPLADPTFTGTVAGITKSMVGLGNVDNTADTAKPVSTAQSTAIATAKAEAIADATSQVNALLTGAPAALNTLDELAAALGDDANFAASVTTSLGLKVDSLTPISQKTASYTLSSLTERDDLIEMSSATGVTLTIPTDATLDFPIGTSIDILQTGAGQVTIAPVSGTVTVNATPGLKLRTTWSSCTLFKRAANTWVVYGDLTA